MLESLFIPAANRDSRRLMIVLHGLGDTLESFRSLPAEINLPWLNYLLVNAPNAYFTGFSWFDFPGDPVPGANQSYLQLQQLLDAQRERGYPTEQTVLFGFSQGGLMVWEAGVRYPHRFAGCIGISGFTREPGELLKLRSPCAAQQRFFITHGMMDMTIPIEKSEEQVKQMKQAGLQVEWTEIIKGHTIEPFGEILLIRRAIERFFEPFITHGLMDNKLPIENSRRQVDEVKRAGLKVFWSELSKGHQIDPMVERPMIRRIIAHVFKLPVGVRV